MELNLLPSEVFKRFKGEVYGDEFPSSTHIGHKSLSISEKARTYLTWQPIYKPQQSHRDEATFA